MQLNHHLTLALHYRWQPLKQINKQQIPASLWFWLTTSQSITAELKKRGRLTVEFIEDGWGKATPREKRRLKMKPRDAARVRTVLLKVNGRTVIYARSIIPANALRGHWRQVKHLHNKPLGGYLFKHRALKRSPIEVAALPKGLFTNHHTKIWARRSVFQQFGSGILVSEAFFETMA